LVMKFSKAVSLVLSDQSFTPSDGYLVHGFWSDGLWQIGFYSEDADTITAYSVGDSVVRQTPEPVFKDDGAVPALAVENVILDVSEAERIAVSALEAKYPGHPMTKSIILVQSIQGVACFNITLVTATLHMYNIKINASSGDVVSELFDSIMSLKAE